MGSGDPPIDRQAASECRQVSDAAMKLRQILACLLLGAPLVAPALAEPVAARCKIERTVNLGDPSMKATMQSENQRANPAYDWVFVYDTATGHICQGDSGHCARSADNTTETDGEIIATLKEAGADTQGKLSIRPDGRWTYQQRMVLTQGGKGDCTLGPPTDHQIALLTRNPAKDRDVLCAARLAVEADILHAQGQSQHVQSILAWAQTLLDSTSNRGYDREARSAVIKAERARYAARDDALRRADFAICQARIAESTR
jgi:hypothetical protein